MAWLGLELARGSLARSRSGPGDLDPGRFALERDPARMSARELRVLPGIGARRALSIVAARWRHDGSRTPFTWKDVPGVGPRTERKVQDWLARHGLGQELCGAPGAEDGAQKR